MKALRMPYSTYRMEPAQIEDLIAALSQDGYTVMGPTIQQEAIVYDGLESSTDLPIGWTDEQEGGRYRLVKRDDDAMFGYAVGPHSWKKFLFPPMLRVWQARLNGQGGMEFTNDSDETRYAFIGVRSCELHAIAIQDKVFTKGDYVDPHYKSLRDRLFVVAVNCAQAGGTCFCVSMKTGPKATDGYDLSLTEVVQGDAHYFTAEAGTQLGQDMLERIAGAEATPDEVVAAERVIEVTEQHMGRTMDTTGIKDLLYRNHENIRWDDVAERCLTCGNCTMACPTCFCSAVEDTSDVTGQTADRSRRWDSCFTMDFSHLQGGSVRSSGKARYRQWMTHKLASWMDQFGTSGCVGCGRCITWCPVGIDITEEVQAIRDSESGGNG